MGWLKRLFSRQTSGTQTYGPRRWFGGSATISEDTAMKVAAFNRGVIYIATQIAKLPWEIKDKSNKIQEGSIADLLSLSPNSEMNAFSFRVVTIINAIVKGNSYAEIERDNSGRPIALWPITGADVDLVRTRDTGRLYYRISGESAPNGEIYMNPRDIFHIKNFHTKDGLTGQGLAAYAAETLGIAHAADQMAGGIFRNGGVPSGVLTVTGTLSDEAYKRLESSWIAQQGGKESGGTAILEQGTVYAPINIEPDTLQFLESRQFGVLEIARFLGLPPTKLFDTTATTFANVENANLEVATDTLDAWAVNLEMEADVKLLNNRFGGRYTELDLYSVFRGDMTTRSAYFKAMMSVGGISPNEIRAREGMAPYTGGENFYIATNNFTPVDRLDEVIDSQIASKNKADSATPPAKDTNPEDTELVKAATRFLISSK